MKGFLKDFLFAAGQVRSAGQSDEKMLEAGRAPFAFSA